MIKRRSLEEGAPCIIHRDGIKRSLGIPLTRIEMEE